MHRFLAARCATTAAFWLVLLLSVTRAGDAQTTWNDPRSLSLAEGATGRRLQQLADTGLKDYRAVAHGYVTFLAQLGEELRTPPKIIKSDELELEVYWRAPNLSKQRIIGRRDTLLLPTDIAYHADHLGIAQNNLPNAIRIGDGDEVADVPHPLSPIGLREYDYALADSFAIGTGAQRIRVYEIKVRPKDDKQPRVIGAVYIEPDGMQVVRMSLTFTRSAMLDKSLEELSVVLENRLVGGRFWLPSEQKLEIVRRGEWLDFPARGIINGRWEIGDYQFNQNLSPVLFVGPEIVPSPADMRTHVWKGKLLDSLPADVRAITEPDIARVQEEARALVRARELASARSATLAARNVSDFARFDRVEGLALGGGLREQLGAGSVAFTRARYGVDDRWVKGVAGLEFTDASARTLRLSAMRDFRDVGDVAERSSVVNSIAGQEFASDYTDPYLVRGVAATVVLATVAGFDPRITASYEVDSPLEIHATPVRGTFPATLGFAAFHTSRLDLELNRPAQPWVGDSQLGVRFNARALLPRTTASFDASFRPRIVATLEDPVGDFRLVTSTTAAAVFGSAFASPTEFAYFGGPVSAPGYDYHALSARSGLAEHVEFRVPAPFVGFSLGRYGRVPSRATVAPYAHAVFLGHGGSRDAHVFPAIGAAYILPFDLVRFDIARGLGRGGRWTFNVDVSRELWSIL